MDELIIDIHGHAANIVDSLIVSIGASSTFALASIVTTSFGRGYRSYSNNSANSKSNSDSGNYRPPK